MKTGFALLAALAGLYLVASPNGLVVSVGLLTFLAGMAVVCRSIARTQPAGCGEDGRPVPPGPAVTYHPRTLHLVSERPAAHPLGGVESTERPSDPESSVLAPFRQVRCTQLDDQIRANMQEQDR